MKYRIVLAFIIIIALSNNVYAQNKIFWRTEYNEDAKAFIKFIDTVTTLNYNFKKLFAHNKKCFHLKKRYKCYKFGEYKYYKYEFTPIGTLTPTLNDEMGFAPKLFGQVDIVLKKNKPYIASGYIRLINILNNESDDSTIYKKMGINLDCRNCFRNGVYYKFHRNFLAIDSNEKKFITKIGGSRYSDLIIQDYCEKSGTIDVFIKWGKTVESNLFTNHYNIYNIQSQPHLKHISEIFSEKKYDTFSELLYSRSPVFNWFIAEALNFYNTKDNFLTLKDKGEIANYNGKNGFIKFRSNELLGKLYR